MRRRRSTKEPKGAASAPPAPAGAARRPDAIVLFGAAALLFASVDRTCFAVALVPLRAQLGLSEAAAGALQSAFQVGYGLTCAPGGWVADRYGGLETLVGSLFLWSAAVALTPLAAASSRPVAALALARFAFGACSGPALPAAAAACARGLPAARRAGGISTMVTGLNLGSALGLLLGGLVPLVGWPALLAACGAAGVATAARTRAALAPRGGGGGGGLFSTLHAPAALAAHLRIAKGERGKNEEQFCHVGRPRSR